MKLFGKLIKGTVIVNEAIVENNENISYTDNLEKCLLAVCKELEISVPMWLEKNTKEFSRFRRTFFFDEQFNEKVYFDRFEIKQID